MLPIVLAFAHAARFVPLAALIMVVVLRRLDTGLLEAAHLTEARWARRARLIGAPLGAPGLIAAFGGVALLSMGDVAITVLAAPAGAGTVAMRIQNLMHYGSTGAVATLGLATLAASLLLGGLVSVILTRREGP